VIAPEVLVSSSVTPGVAAIAAAIAAAVALLAGWLLGRARWDKDDASVAAATPADIREPRGSPEAGTPADAGLTDDERFRQLVVQVEGFAIFMLDAAGRNRTWNEGVKRLVGYDEQEWLGQDVSHIFTPEDQARGAAKAELREAAERGQASDDRWLVRKDGQRFFATGLTTAMRNGGGRLIGFSKVFRDRTEERRAAEALAESESRLRVALQAARMGIWSYHIPTDSQRIDQSMAPLLGLGTGERIESLDHFFLHVHPEDRERVEAGFHHTMVTGENMDLEFRVVWPDGTVRWLTDHGQVVLGADGKPEFLTGAALDVTERKTAEAKLVQAQRMDAVGQLAGGVAHEVNNMMQAVLGYTALLLSALDRREADRPDLLHIQRAAERAATITRQLLAFSRRQVIHPQVLDLNEIVRDLEPILRRSLGEDRELRLELADRLDRIWADRGSLEQVLLNLGLNARDAMPAGGTMTVATRPLAVSGREPRAIRRHLAPGHYIVLAVSDTGHGMDEATRLRAFEPFFTTKPVGQGTGLGLAMVQGIVEQSGGSVRLNSAPGEGTAVELFFPAVRSQRRTPAPPEPPSPPGGAGLVLVVEDEELVREYVCRSLRGLGYTCWPAASGAEALALLETKSTPPDLVLTDLVMPGMSGRELADRIAARQPGVPVVYTSAHSSEEVVRRGLVAPGADYLQKPFTLDALATTVRAMVRQPRD
jgi:two-component system cell cycle sensor histidine kinase/response regulator CckA